MSKNASNDTSVSPVSPAIKQLDKIRIVLEGLRGEDSIAELCRREGINSNVYYRWSKDFLEAGKKRFSEDALQERTPLYRSTYFHQSVAV